MTASSPQPPPELVDAIAGLTYPSDSDEPWRAFLWPAAKLAVTPRQALEQHVDAKRAIVEVSLETFFSQLGEADNAERYARLRRTVQQLLSNIAIIRVGDGETQVGVFIVGQLADGSVAGVTTVSVET